MWALSMIILCLLAATSNLELILAWNFNLYKRI
jgi:hypothetical protein